MNKRIDFTNLGGFPATQDTLDFMQSSYREALKAVARLCGDKVIIAGVTVVGSVVSDGWIAYNGELIPFIGGTVGANVVIAEAPSDTQAVFNDTNERDVYFTKTATIGSPGTFPFADLARLTTLKQMWLTGDVKEVDCDGAYIAANFDGTGLGINERSGWAICNGSNGTRDRGGRISIGYSTVTVDPADDIWDVIYNTIGATAGLKSAVVTEDNIEAFDVTVPASSGTGGIGHPVAGGDTTDGNLTTTVGVADPDPIDLRGPVIVTLFIQKING